MLSDYQRIGKSKTFQLSNVDKATLRGRYESLLLRKGWKQTDLANAVSCDKALICRVINGKEKPSATMLVKIAKALEVDSSVLLYGFEQQEEATV